MLYILNGYAESHSDWKDPGSQGYQSFSQVQREGHCQPKGSFRTQPFKLTFLKSETPEMVLGSLLLWNNPSIHCVNLCRYDWFHKQADWPIAEQDKVSQECQTKNYGMRKGGVKGVARQVELSQTHKMG